MKTFYNKFPFSKILKLPALIFFLLALSYTAKSQYVTPAIACYGEPLQFFCASAAGCDLPGSTYTWFDQAGSWSITGTGPEAKDPVIYPPSPGNPSPGYHAGVFFLSVQYLPDGLSSGVVTVILLNQLFVPGTASPVSCNGGSNGAITISPYGGQPLFGGGYGPYAWSNGATTQNISGLSAGTYTVTVTDGNFCKATSSFTVTEPAGMTITKTGGANVLCNGFSTGSVSVSVSGGAGSYGYFWNTGGTTSTISNLSAGTYTVTVTDLNTCTKSATFLVTETNGMSISINGTSPSCYGGTNGTISTTVSGGTTAYNYAWSNGGANTSGRSGLSAGTYTVTVTDANFCTKSATYQVVQTADITISGTPVKVACQGTSTGQITTTITGGSGGTTGYLWNNNQTGATATNLSAGTYTVTFTNGANCTKSQSFVVTENTALSFGSVVNTPAKCYNSSDGSIQLDVSGGVTSYTYLWNNSQTGSKATNLSAGFYTVTVTDGAFCTKVGSWQVTAPTAMSINGTPTNLTCNNNGSGKLDITVTGGTPTYSYSWNASVTQGNGTAHLTGLLAGTYTVTVTDLNSCVLSQSWLVTQPSALSGDGAVKNVTCFGGNDGTATMSGFGGTAPYSYYWITGSSAQLITGLTAGIYAVTITDFKGCPNYTSRTITQPSDITISGTPVKVNCNGFSTGTITTSINGGSGGTTGYLWSNNQTGATATNLSAGTYTVTFTNTAGCTKSQSFIVTQNSALDFGAVISTPAKCYNSSDGSIQLFVSGGVTSYTYLWNNLQTGSTATNLSAGFYTVTVTDGALCTKVGSWQVTAPTAMSINGTPTNLTCNNNGSGKLDITVTGGSPTYSYSWNASVGQGNGTAHLSGLLAGTYTVTVTDQNSCVLSQSWLVTQPTALSGDGAVKNVTCYGGNDGTATMSGFGGTAPYYYHWITGSTAQLITGLTAGSYAVTITDANSCPNYTSRLITQPSQLTVLVASKVMRCFGYSDGSLTATVSGGVTPYSYLWNNSLTTSTISGLSAGTYTVTVTDQHSCTKITTATITQPAGWSVDIAGPLAACCNANVDSHYDASILGDTTGVGCTSPWVTYQWVVIGGTISSGWNTKHITVDWDCCTQGTVTVVATKCDGCTVSKTIQVAVSLPPAPVISGPVSVYANTSTTYCTPNFPGPPAHLYTWTVVGGSVISGQGTHCITVLWGPFPPCGCGTVTVCETDPATGCSSCTTLNITILPVNQNLEGTVMYKNTYNTALNGVTVKLRNPSTGTIVATTVSGPNMNPPDYTGAPGYFAFTNVPTGNYQLEATFNGTWGGNNATDALLVQLYVADPIANPLTGLNLTVADVNASLTYTGLDALYIKLRTVGSITSYPAGDWKFNNPTVTIPTSNPNNILGLCVGDVNGSYIPAGLKEASLLTVKDDDVQTIPVNQSFTYNIKSNAIANLGAMTLFMGYDQNLFEIESVNTTLEGMKYVIDGGKIALAWSDTKPLSVKNDEPIISLTMSAKELVSQATQIFSLIPGSEFADTKAIRYENFDLKMSKVITPNGVNEFSMFNYPNPFKNTTNIVYTLPESGKVRLVLTNMYGKTVRVLVDEMQNAGSYTVPVNTLDNTLTPGVYLYKIEVNGATDTYVRVNKMMFTR